ncbi:uncharacterized protein MONOS_8979 [Monocercomonoides exilis]|uniref:uncharacterized protein n=1 Tax=Monocercomonoides exilis TaxID=2049356 RepID=UPI00355A4B35|nr:hypothetical protein MONOS_8979 [Monocercomonoides exilis]|eukprot:MONOS_8979.1-p1 / transcript=MONOS_8979.1 / gene=MONOS_8979 / organism=Monocercomonoides_exilis_PA203 / gene_product=unspecified product / transcript_product=unspecified product / location=Mono_scaffold00354:57860-58678(+) / protein_length=253 / sequence_SO=supercontig / SO=protein_coding / is_pseudo=false
MILDDKEMGRCAAVCEVVEIAKKGMEEVGLRMEDVVLLPEEIVQAVLEEREEEEEGGVNKVKNGYPTAHREFVERIKENQGKLEEAMAPLVVEAVGLSLLRFVKVAAEAKAETETEAEDEAYANKQHLVEPKVCSSSPSDGIQQEISRAEEEAAVVSFGITSDESADELVKDEEFAQLSKNEIEKEIEEEEEEEEQIFDEESPHLKFLKLIDESAYESWQDYLVAMTVTEVPVELCAECERIEKKPVMEGMI